MAQPTLSQTIKYALLGVAMLLTVLLLFGRTFVPNRDNPTSHENLVAERAELNAVSATGVMVSPRYTGRDEKNGSWEVKGSEARQSGGLGNEEVALDDIAAQLTPVDGTPIHLSARQGRFIRVSETLILSGGVKADGYGATAEMPELTAFLDTRSGFSDGPVTVTFQRDPESTHGRLASGTLTAGRLEVENEGNLIHLTHGVKGRFYLVNG